ncbi:DNA internalization-related competence protein ComEC/Rec2 [Umezawaea tangerina]|uniref:Competence protein ComEC n=1 Tax=Umezawaea tangerina TaxID=84725 RepID=A0A2T0SS10_9PSEU|nr:DNA internalization-related competence protein ComEC/Rec2 [Umezawaea tangerina]PRY36190.1 competence protein ComEC [Umezawaea tangerina]
MSPHVRLVPAALVVWAVALGGLLWSWLAAVLIGACACLVGAVVLRKGWCERSCALALVVVAPVAAGSIGLRVQQSESHPVRAAASRGEAVVLRAELVNRPRGLRTEGFAGRQGGVQSVVVRADITSVEQDGSVIDEGGEVLLVAPVSGWRNLLPGQEVTARGVLAPARPGELTVAVLRVRGPPSQAGPAPVWQRAAEVLRSGLREASTALDPEPAGLLPALVVGDTAEVSSRVEDEFRTSGLAHLLAVSGANLAILCGAVLLLLRIFRVGPKGCAAGASVALVGFVVLAGPEPSVLRAAVMGAVALLALVLGRERSALPALAATVVVLVLYDPALGVEPGFALSVVATAALVLLAPRWAAALRDRGVPIGLAEALAVPMAASVVTAPLVVAISGRISLVSVVANLVAAPVVAPATVLGVLAAVVAPVHHGAARVLVELSGPEVGWLITVGRKASEVPGGSVAWLAGWQGGLLLTGVLLVVYGLVKVRRTRTLLAAALVGAVVVLVPTQVVAPGWPPAGWSVVACDVGQGDAVVLATAEPGRAVLVDTGPDPAPVAACLRRLGIRRIPLLVLSHLHADHVGGLAAVLADRSVGAVAIGPSHEPGWAWEEVRRRTRAAGVDLVELTAGQRLDWPGLVLEVLGPKGEPASAEDENTAINDSSLVLRARTAAGRVLLTGDIELAGQAGLLGGHVDLAAEVLKVPHHGSRFSAPEFLAAVRPRVALVSVGAGNRYGHPNGPVIDALTRRGALVLRTDRDGDTAVLRGEGGPLVVRRKR